MDADTFKFLLIASLAEIRAALWYLVGATGTAAATILVHALLTRRR